METNLLGSFIEMPLTDVTAFESILGGSAGLPKLRTELGKALHWPNHRVSLGRQGTVSLGTAPLLGCLATGWRWDRQQAMRLGQCYNQAGFGALLGTQGYRHAVDAFVDRMRTALGAASPHTSINRVLRSTMDDLIEGSVDVKRIVIRLTEITAEVDQRVGEMKRSLGWVERIEANEALVVVQGSSKELRTMNSRTLAAMGIEQPGDYFIQYQYQWSQDTISSMYVPAVSAEPRSERIRRLADLEDSLVSHNTPLPQRKRVASEAVTARNLE